MRKLMIYICIDYLLKVLFRTMQRESVSHSIDLTNLVDKRFLDYIIKSTNTGILSDFCHLTHTTRPISYNKCSSRVKYAFSLLLHNDFFHLQPLYGVFVIKFRIIDMKAMTRTIKYLTLREHVMIIPSPNIYVTHYMALVTSCRRWYATMPFLIITTSLLNPACIHRN